MEHSNVLRTKTIPSEPPEMKTSPIGLRTGNGAPIPDDGDASLARLEAASRLAHHELAAERRAAHQARLEKAIGRSGIPARFAGKAFSQYHAETEAQSRALNLCSRYAKDFCRVRAQGNSLLFVGAPGTGKTHLACAVLQQVIRQGYTGLFAGMSEILRLIRSSYSQSSRLTEVEAFTLYSQSDLLVIDEVGVSIGDHEKRRAMLFDVLNARYGEVKPTLLIGNLTVEKLEAYLGERVMDRLLENGGVVVPFTWASHRRRSAQAV